MFPRRGRSAPGWPVGVNGAPGFSPAALAGSSEVFDHHVDADFEGICRRFQDRWNRIIAGGEALCDGEVVKKVTATVHPIVTPVCGRMFPVK